MEYTWTLADETAPAGAGDDHETDGPRLRNPQGRNDFVGGIDSEALDFSQLEDFINNEDEGESTYFVDTLGHHEGQRSANQGAATIVVVETTDDSANGPNNGPRLTLQSSTGIASNFTLSHNLPESPPDSGSEPPYSPQQDGDKNLSHSKHLTTQEILLHGSHTSLYTNPHLSLKQSHLHPAVVQQSTATHLHETMLMQHPVLTPLLSASTTALLNSSARNDAILLSRSDAAILEMNNADTTTRGPLLNRVLNAATNANLMNHTQPNSPPINSANHTTVQTIPANFESNDENSGITTIFSSVHGNAKKRKLSDDVSGPVVYVKQEKKEPNLDMSPESNSSHAVLGDDGYELDGVCVDANFQCIRFQPFQQTQWHVLCDQNLKELPVPHYRVDADKGFNFSNADDAFVCQKKNHFQITCHTQLLGDAQFIKTPEGVKKITSFYLHFYGVKVESPSQIIKVEQSQSDRSKKPFHPVLVELQGEQVTKVTVGRLHFSETTSNNMRKKGKPNPDQRYFYLVVGLHAHTMDNNYQVVAHASERIIVRASNPGQFESDVELCWQKGHTADSIFHAGRVGINTDRPDECLVVHGNLKVTGHIVQPSDLRAKLHLQECNTKDQLKNIEKLRVVKYRYADEFAEHLGISEDTGVIAQEVREVLPDAVRAGGDINLPSGEIIQNFLVVNKDRIFMENVGAVKELCKVTDHLGKRIDQVEKMNRRLAKLKKIDSFKSTCSASSVSSKLHGVDTEYPKCEKQNSAMFLPSTWTCSNQAIHIAIGVLVLIMAVCVIAMASLYFLQAEEQQKMKLKDEQNFWRNPSTDLRQNSAIRSSNHKRPWSVGSTLSNLLDSNRTAATLNHLLDANRTRLLGFHKGERNKSTRLLPLFHRHTSDTTRGLPTTIESSKSSRTHKPLGRPPHCTASGLFQETDDSPCQSFCCGEERLVPTAAKLPIVQEPTFDAQDEEPSSLTHQKHNEVENPPPAATNTIDHGQRSKHGRNVDLDAAKKQRAKRNTEELDNGHFYLPNIHDQNGVVVSLYGSFLNQTLNTDFCANDVTDFTLCLDKAANNYTYHIPISRYFQDDFIFVEFQFHKGRNLSQVHVCQEILPQQDCVPGKSAPERPILRDSNLFMVELWHYPSALMKYRIPITSKMDKICQAGKQDLGVTFLEYNLLFYRDCEE